MPTTGASTPAAYQPRWASSCSDSSLEDSRLDHRRAEAGRGGRDALGVGVVRRRLDDRLRAPLGILALEDPRADEHALGAELHHQRRVSRRRDPAGAEQDDRQLAALGDAAHEVQRRLVLLRRGRQLGRRRAPASRRIWPVILRMCVTALTMSPVPASPLERIIAAPSPIRRSASPRFVAPHTNGTLKAHLSMWFASSAGVSTSDSST